MNFLFPASSSSLRLFGFAFGDSSGAAQSFQRYGFFRDDGDGKLEVPLLEDEIQIGDLAGKADQLDDRDVIEVDGVGVDLAL